ncbi:MAG: GntR family transcriptional regulator [Rhizobiales bacterium]|nr:GntR family transcriptional regulator [Hyphomicrobiales bacterium]OJY42135.1 MAG: GntR family transcriptional regulator [Rhizobiales bacterium 64-17]
MTIKAKRKKTAPRQRTRTSVDIAEDILHDIRTGRLAPGDHLSQYQLAEMFSTSRTPIREALRFLEARSVISLTPSGRAKIKVPTPKTVREAFQIRAELEGLAAELATNWLTADELKTLQGLQAKYADALRSTAGNGKPSAWLTYNEQFHAVISKASQNDRLVGLIDEMNKDVIGIILSYAAQIPYHLMEENIAQHEDILAALTKRDSAAAKAAMRNHILRTTDIFLTWLESQSG